MNRLQRLKVQTIVNIVCNDQIRFIRSANQLNRYRIHIPLDVGCSRSRAAVCQTGKSNRLPERIAGAVDATIRSGGWSIRHSSTESGDVFAAVTRTVQVNIRTDTVCQLRLGNVHTTVKQVDNRFLTAVLDHFKTADRNSSSVLSDTELRRTDRAVLRNVKHFVTRIRIRVVRCAVVVHHLLEYDIPTTEGLNIPAFFEAAQKRIVVCYVVGQLTRTTLNVGRNDVADRAIGKSHDESSL